MQCFGQIIYESGSYALPLPDSYVEWDGIGDAKDALARTWNDLDVDPANGQGVSLLLWLGKVDPEWSFPCDDIPDRVYVLGPRHGVQRSD
jgi:hypothetical protein